MSVCLRVRVHLQQWSLYPACPWLPKEIDQALGSVPCYSRGKMMALSCCLCHVWFSDENSNQSSVSDVYQLKVDSSTNSSPSPQQKEDPSPNLYLPAYTLTSVFVQYPGLDASGPVFYICYIVDRSGNGVPSVRKLTKLTYHATLTISGNLAKGASDVFLCFPNLKKSIRLNITLMFIVALWFSNKYLNWFC